MKKETKQTIIKGLEGLFDASSTYYLVDFKKLKVSQAVELRKLLRKNSYSYKVIKNRLALRALGDRAPEALRPYFQKPTAIAFAAQEPRPRTAGARGVIATPQSRIAQRRALV